MTLEVGNPSDRGTRTGYPHLVVGFATLASLPVVATAVMFVGSVLDSFVVARVGFMCLFVITAVAVGSIWIGAAERWNARRQRPATLLPIARASYSFVIDSSNGVQLSNGSSERRLSPTSTTTS